MNAPLSNDVVPQRRLMIKNLIPSLPERGKIKIGMKGAVRTSGTGKEFQPPKKLDHFLVTGLERGQDGNFKRDEAIHQQIGDAPKAIPVRLLYDDPALNFPTRYAMFSGRTLVCSGDGETATKLDPKAGTSCERACPCEFADPARQGAKCKMNGALSVLLDLDVGGIGGVWKFRTTSYNSIVGIMSTMAFLRSQTGGILANIPLVLTVTPKQATAPDGSQLTIQVVGLEFRGKLSDLLSSAHEIALFRAKTHVSIAEIETEARRLLSLPAPNAPLPGDDIDDVVDEFYPAEAAAAPKAQGRARLIEDSLRGITRGAADVIDADVDLPPAPAPEDDPLAIAKGVAAQGRAALDAHYAAAPNAVKKAIYPHMAELVAIADASGPALSAAARAGLAELEATTTEADLEAAWERLDIEVCRELGAGVLEEQRARVGREY
ncbi:hypothetical protein [Phaeospirillum tilakii]|uniref:Uncharacterized protein n=1 Tax=Phaeospirillum tilakii TaxID=741673 RepID=A0ABW5C6P1_9PROT